MKPSVVVPSGVALLCLFLSGGCSTGSGGGASGSSGSSSSSTTTTTSGDFCMTGADPTPSTSGVAAENCPSTPQPPLSACDIPEGELCAWHSCGDVFYDGHCRSGRWDFRSAEVLPACDWYELKEGGYCCDLGMHLRCLTGTCDAAGGNGPGLECVDGKWQAAQVSCFACGDLWCSDNSFCLRRDLANGTSQHACVTSCGACSGCDCASTKCDAPDKCSVEGNVVVCTTSP